MLSSSPQTSLSLCTLGSLPLSTNVHHLSPRTRTGAGSPGTAPNSPYSPDCPSSGITPVPAGR